MHNRHQDRLHIGDMAEQTGVSTDTIRYYEQLGLLSAPARTKSGYRLYGETEVGRLLFIRRAKLLGISLEEIRGLLGLAEEGACSPLRHQVAELLCQKIAECKARLAELAAFKASLEECYQQVRQQQAEAACTCSAFSTSCSCLPVPLEEIVTPNTQISSRTLNDKEQQ